MRKNKRTIFSQALLAAFACVFIFTEAGSVLAVTDAALPADSINNTETGNAFAVTDAALPADSINNTETDSTFIHDTQAASSFIHDTQAASSFIHDTQAASSFIHDTQAASSFEDGLTSIQDNSGKDISEKQPDGSVPSQKKETAAGRWKEKKQQFFYCVKGRRIKGIYKIGKNDYYFDKNGVQRTGWQKIGNDYYFFRIANGKKGYQLRSQTVNGIRLGAKGKARITADSRKKLDVMVTANQILQKAAKPAMKKPEKLRKAFDYLLKHYRYAGSPSFKNSAHWEQDYAQFMFSRHHGNCYAYGAAFAFLANAAGYQKCYAVSSGGHGWAEVSGKIYDPSWCLTDTRYSYFGISPALSGTGGRPNYKRARKFAVRI